MNAEYLHWSQLMLSVNGRRVRFSVLIKWLESRSRPAIRFPSFPIIAQFVWSIMSVHYKAINHFQLGWNKSVEKYLFWHQISLRQFLIYIIQRMRIQFHRKGKTFTDRIKVKMSGVWNIINEKPWQFFGIGA